MEFSFYIVIFAVTVNSVFGDGHFYLTVLSGSEISLMKGESPINTVNTEWGAKGYYNSSMNQTGWDILEVISNPDSPDDNQAYHVGWIEGFLTQKQIYYHWYNTVRPTCLAIPATCVSVKKYLNDNWNWIKTQLASGDIDPYWHQVQLFYRQIDGLYDGYMNASSDGEKLSYEDLIMLNFDADVMTLTESLANKTEKNKIKKSGHCSVLIKFLPGYSDVLFAHNAWISFNYMNRIIKRYNFAYHWSGNSTKLIPGQSQTFSSYGGVITSLDDFYIINSGLVSTETTNNVYDESLYKYNKPNGQIMETVRSAVANRLSSSTAEWSHYFSLMNSGTYNNQWMVLDLKKFRQGFEPEAGFFQVVEQMPGLITSKDMTLHLVQHSYWASYNIPFFKNVFSYSGYEKKEQENGTFYSYTNCSRAKIFAREQTRVVDLDSMIKTIRYNHYKTDPYSVCSKCDPQPNACMTISSRCDLNPAKGNYTMSGLGFHPFGALDAKIGSYSMFKNGEMIAIGGPTHSDDIPPFNWKTTQPNNMSHLGQPDLWNFEPILTSWIQPYVQSIPDRKVITLYTTSTQNHLDNHI